jgi:hypothetical protein
VNIPGETSPRSASWVDYVLFLAGVVGLTFAIASVWLGMRAVMDIGGYCASGGSAYEIAVQCPAGVDVIMVLAFPLGFLSGGVMVWTGSRIGGSYPGLVGLAWPALFLSLGWNFLQYAFHPPGGDGSIELGWLIPGVLFVLMVGFPLLGWIISRDHTTILPGVGAQRTPKDLADVRRAVREAARLAASDEVSRSGYAGVGRVEVPAANDSLVSQLERLARLHAAGSISDAEYDKAKRALLATVTAG